MFLTKAALVLLLCAHICMRARSEIHYGEESVGDCFDVADVALVVDVSGSIEGDGKFPGKFDEYVKPFLKAFCGGLNVRPGRVQIGMVTFGNTGTLEFGLKSDINEVSRNIDLFDYKSRGRNTNTSGGIYVMRTQLLNPKDPNYRPRAAHIAVVVTDGVSNFDHDLTSPSATAAQNDGIVMLVVGVTSDMDSTELVSIASPLTPSSISDLNRGKLTAVYTPSGTVAYVPEITDLNVVANQLVTHFKKTVCYTDCPFGDKATWCATVLKTSCSDGTIRAICCKTCPKEPNSVGR